MVFSSEVTIPILWLLIPSSNGQFSQSQVRVACILCSKVSIFSIYETGQSIPSKRSSHKNRHHTSSEDTGLAEEGRKQWLSGFSLPRTWPLCKEGFLIFIKGLGTLSSIPQCLEDLWNWKFFSLKFPGSLCSGKPRKKEIQRPHSLLLLLGRYFRDSHLCRVRGTATALNDHATLSKFLFVCLFHIRSSRQAYKSQIKSLGHSHYF